MIHPTSSPGSSALCVIASGSSGNCSVLVVNEPGARRVALIDAGLSPRRTARLLGERAIKLHEVSDILLTHLDTDHCHAGWLRHRDNRARIHLHASHVDRAVKAGLPHDKLAPFEGDFDVWPTVSARPVLMSHDELGVASFRFDIEGRASLGFATDLGRATDDLIDHLSGVDVLAIESNYCRQMQIDSDRPWFLKQRIMNGAGHLSNDEAAQAVRRIAPRDHVVFLHLSRQCNDPERVAQLHAGADYSFTISSQTDPTRWVRIDPVSHREPVVTGLFSVPRPVA